jgi:CHAD domain-containing protein
LVSTLLIEQVKICLIINLQYGIQHLFVYFYTTLSDKKNILNLYLKHERSFIKRLKRAKSLKEEEVHKLRLEIKNLRTLFEFLESLAEKQVASNSMLQLFKRMFKRAGKIRSTQLNIKLSKPYRTATMVRFREFLEKEEGKAEKEFLKEVKKIDTDTLERLHKKNLKALKKLRSQLIAEDSENYLRTIFTKIRSSMFDIDKDEVLHEIRKLLKTLKNTNSLLYELKQDHTLAEEIKNMHSSYEKIGNWHDGLIFAETFENYIRKKEIPEVQRRALNLVSMLKHKNEKAKLLLIKKLRVTFA